MNNHNYMNIRKQTNRLLRNEIDKFMDITHFLRVPVNKKSMNEIIFDSIT
jgi:hypothetical protein